MSAPLGRAGRLGVLLLVGALAACSESFDGTLLVVTVDYDPNRFDVRTLRMTLSPADLTPQSRQYEVPAGVSLPTSLTASLPAGLRGELGIELDGLDGTGLVVAQAMRMTTLRGPENRLAIDLGAPRQDGGPDGPDGPPDGGDLDAVDMTDVADAPDVPDAVDLPDLPPPPDGPRRLEVFFDHFNCPATGDVPCDEFERGSLGASWLSFPMDATVGIVDGRVAMSLDPARGLVLLDTASVYALRGQSVTVQAFVPPDPELLTLFELTDDVGDITAGIIILDGSATCNYALGKAEPVYLGSTSLPASQTTGVYLRVGEDNGNLRCHWSTDAISWQLIGEGTYQGFSVDGLYVEMGALAGQ